MKYFRHFDAGTLEEASELLHQAINAAAIAGGTDLLDVLKGRILPVYPDVVVNLKTIRGMDYIREDQGAVKIGAMTKLKDIAESPVVNNKLPMLSQAAVSVATPLIRNMGTIGGNICQDVRCWYYRYPNEIGGRMVCARKGGKRCYAVFGENRYHSVFGGIKVDETSCTSKCPANTDIPGYMSRLREGDIDGAARIIMKVNPMPMITSRICARFCQAGCIRFRSDENVAIGNVELYVGDYILKHADKYYPVPDKETGRRIAIVGAGAAGLAAAYYLRQDGHKVTVYDQGDGPGSLLTYATSSNKLPRECVLDLMAAYSQMGVEFIPVTEAAGEIKTDELDKQYDSVFLDTGAWKTPFMGLESEEYQLDHQGRLIEVHEKGNILRKRGVFTSGDVSNGPTTAIKAINTGRQAAIAVNEFLGVADVKGDCTADKETVFLKFNSEGIKKKTACTQEENILEEANRCLNCGCLAANPSDILPVLLALDATIKTSNREISAADFSTKTPLISDVLEKGELVIEITIPAWEGYKLTYDKFRTRESLDFAIVSVASAFAVEGGRIKDARIVLGGVAPVPLRAQAVENYLSGKNIDETVAGEAAEIAVKGTITLGKNDYKVQEIRTMIKRAILNLI